MSGIINLCFYHNHAYYCIAILIQIVYKVNKLVFKTKSLNLKGVGIDHCYKKQENKEHAVASYSEMIYLAS